MTVTHVSGRYGNITDTVVRYVTKMDCIEWFALLDRVTVRFNHET